MIKYKIVPIAAVLVIAASIFFHPKKKQELLPVNYSLFRTGTGWGYNILVNDSIFIHQENIPVLTTNKSFDTEEQATVAAETVIGKIKVNKPPMLTLSDVETILLNKGLPNGK